MRTYFGVNKPDSNNLIGVSDNTMSTPSTRYLNIAESQKVYNHSADFAWGYGGSGPAQTALAILLDHTGKPEEAQRWHQDFKWDFVSGWENTWRITNEQIDKWLLSKRQEAAPKGSVAKGKTLSPIGPGTCPTGHPGATGQPGSIQG